ncbi:transposase family protein [Streptomyces sp. NPDC005890]|uniref:transposase family protein n=1 Tax=Streptomyces sp. NPDC005890 TaxID=3154568 RepID=UPI00340D4F1C
MLIESDRLAGTRDNGNDLWFSQKHKSFGGNVPFLSAPDGTPLWVSDVEPGSTPDITAARQHVLPALYKAAADGLPTLADKGYIGAGIGIRVPVRRPKGKSEQALDADTRPTNCLVRDLRALGERTAAELKERYRTGYGIPCPRGRRTPRTPGVSNERHVRPWQRQRRATQPTSSGHGRCGVGHDAAAGEG